MDAKETIKIITQIANLVAEKYVFSQAGEHVAGQLRNRLADDSFFAALTPVKFAEALTQELQALSHDSHLQLDYDPEQAATGGNSDELMHQHFERVRRTNFGFAKAEGLAGNIGYLAVREFPPPEVAGEVAAGALAFVANTQALIFDIRGNGGGTPGMVQLLISYLVGENPRPLSGIYSRETNETELWQTLADIPGQRMLHAPVYVLVDRETHSAAEAFAYDLQALKRATIVGERTRGGAHLVDFYPLHNLFVLRLPVARAINPITGSNWQGSGVMPDIEVPAEQALQEAHRRALQELWHSAQEDDLRAFLQAEMETL